MGRSEGSMGRSRQKCAQICAHRGQLAQGTENSLAEKPGCDWDSSDARCRFRTSDILLVRQAPLATKTQLRRQL